MFYEDKLKCAQSDSTVHNAVIDSPDKSEDDDSVRTISDSLEEIFKTLIEEQESDQQLEEFQDRERNDTTTESDDDNNAHHSQMPKETSRLRRTAKLKDWKDFVTFNVSAGPSETELANVQKALSDLHWKKWNKAMKEERIDAKSYLEALEEN